MRKVKYKQRIKSSKKNSRHKTRNNYAIKNNDTRRNGTRKCKKGETDETIRIRKLTEFVEGHNQIYNLLNKKYKDIQSHFTCKKDDKKDDKKNDI